VTSGNVIEATSTGGRKHDGFRVIARKNGRRVKLAETTFSDGSKIAGASSLRAATTLTSGDLLVRAAASRE
jgi:hypothetical protein